MSFFYVRQFKNNLKNSEIIKLVFPNYGDKVIVELHSIRIAEKMSEANGLPHLAKAVRTHSRGQLSRLSAKMSDVTLMAITH